MTTRAGFVALIGEPNAGKSTLLNRMVGAKVSIVTHKVQTTRARIRGIAMAGEAQIVFVDTPGIFRPRRRLDRSMVKAAWGGASDADVIVLLIEAHRGLTEGAQAIIERLRDEMPKGKPVALAINKIDRVKAETLLALAEEANTAFPFAKTFMISAERGHGVEDLRDWLGSVLPEGPWFYPEDQIADLPMRMIAASASLAIGQAARAEISEFLGRTVHLFLQVKVRPNWLEEAERYSEMGLDFKDGDA